MSLDKLIEKQNTEFYELGSKHGYDQGFHDGIMEAVKILSDAHLANDVMSAQEPDPDGEATFEIPGNDEATFDEKEAYFASIGSTLTVAKDKITRASHVKHSWDDWIIPFAVSIIDGVHTKSELVTLGSEQGLTKDAINKKAWELGYGKNKGEDYFVKKHSPLPKYVDMLASIAGE